ncbi:MAG: hypothetical protein IT349_03110 [Candidatus Eisenbacteria bacterium]|nr:hypothetical protein [Candidatus Eisenbacteria bacterium]MCC7141069.1 hypothetical protein [Candidatus Eisenbacteria bacterium]
MSVSSRRSIVRGYRKFALVVSIRYIAPQRTMYRRRYQMANSYSVNDLLEFLDQSGDRGLMPVSTAQALSVASRNVLGVLSEGEKQDFDQLDLDGVIRRFTSRRAKDLSPTTLREYERRVRRAIDLFRQWRENGGAFTTKTRATSGAGTRGNLAGDDATGFRDAGTIRELESRPGTYLSSLPIRPGLVITIGNIPYDLTGAEAERLATFVRMLAVGE